MTEPVPPSRPLARADAADALGASPAGYEAPVSDWSGVSQDPSVEPTNRPDTPVEGRGRKAAKGATREIVETLLLAAVIFLGVRLLVLNFKVDGNSMRPNLLNGELLLVNRNSYREIDLNGLLDKLPFVERDDPWIFRPFDAPERGDIVVFDPPNGSTEPYIKRILAVAGETVEIKEGGVFVDGVRVVEPYIDEGITECLRATCEPVLVPEGDVWVMGDNRRNSQDSRSFGVVPVENIIGRAWVVYWPRDGIGLVPHYDYPEIADR